MNEEVKVSLESIREAFPHIGSVNQQLICIVINNDSDCSMLEEFESNAKWIKQCHNRPSDLELKLNAINELLEGFGVENITIENSWINSFWQDTIALYINMGDTYSTTILYDTEEQSFEITSYDDFLEMRENTEEKSC